MLSEPFIDYDDNECQSESKTSRCAPRGAVVKVTHTSQDCGQVGDKCYVELKKRIH